MKHIGINDEIKLHIFTTSEDPFTCLSHNFPTIQQSTKTYMSYSAPKMFEKKIIIQIKLKKIARGSFVENGIP